MDTVRILSYSKRLSTLYVISTVLYTPFIIKAALEENGVFDRLLSIYKSIVFGYNHLWYLSASLVSVLLFIVIRLKAKGLLKWTPLLIIGGVLLDKYYLMSNSFTVVNIGNFYSEYLGGGRHAIFFGLPLMAMGYRIAESEIWKKLRLMILMVGLIIFSMLSFVEVTWVLGKFDERFYIDITLFNWIPGLILFLIALKIEERLDLNINTKPLRKIIDIVYIIHPVVIWTLSKIFGLKYGMRFIAAIVLSLVISFIVYVVLLKVSGMRNTVELKILRKDNA